MANKELVVVGVIAVVAVGVIVAIMIALKKKASSSELYVPPAQGYIPLGLSEGYAAPSMGSKSKQNSQLNYVKPGQLGLGSKVDPNQFTIVQPPNQFTQPAVRFATPHLSGAKRQQINTILGKPITNFNQVPQLQALAMGMSPISLINRTSLMGFDPAKSFL